MTDPSQRLRPVLLVLAGGWALAGLVSSRDTLERLREEYLTLLQRYGLPREIAPPELDKATREQLRALGYVH